MEKIGTVVSNGLCIATWTRLPKAGMWFAFDVLEFTSVRFRAASAHTPTIPYESLCNACRVGYGPIGTSHCKEPKYRLLDLINSYRDTRRL